MHKNLHSKDGATADSHLCGKLCCGKKGLLNSGPQRALSSGCRVAVVFMFGRMTIFASWRNQVAQYCSCDPLSCPDPRSNFRTGQMFRIDLQRCRPAISPLNPRNPQQQSKHRANEDGRQEESQCMFVSFVPCCSRSSCCASRSIVRANRVGVVVNFARRRCYL